VRLLVCSLVAMVYLFLARFASSSARVLHSFQRSLHHPPLQIQFLHCHSHLRPNQKADSQLFQISRSGVLEPGVQYFELGAKGLPSEVAKGAPHLIHLRPAALQSRTQRPVQSHRRRYPCY